DGDRPTVLGQPRRGDSLHPAPGEVAEFEAEPAVGRPHNGGMTAEARPTEPRAELVDDFQGRYPYSFDPFQRDAMRALARGSSVLVAAPTGTGKTVIAEFGVFLARRGGLRAIYTTPIKALSNQKYRDFKAIYGDETGLLTGDVVLNSGGSVLVMTTEVLRNMLVQREQKLEDVGVIVFDEVHYVGDKERGTAWEEAILLAPRGVPLVCLSATVPNADEVAGWLRARRACEQAAESCLGLRTVSGGYELAREAKARLADLPPEDRALRQVALLLRLLPRGVAVHHAGLLPVIKMLVEELFAAGRLRAVFATDTLALGINMPARTVVIGEMSKWDGEQHRLLTPNEYRQMT